MVDCKLGYLKTEFSPDRILLVIELVPLPGQEFDEPMDKPVSKLDAVANYAKETFAVRTAPVSTNVPGSQVKPGSPKQAPGRDVQKQDELAKNMRAGAGRAIQVMEQELKRALAEGDPATIKRAQEQLTRAKSMDAKQKAQR